MKNFIKVIKEINRTLNFLIFFESLLNSVVFFLIVYFLLSLVNLYPISAIIPAIVYFISRMYFNMRIDKNKSVESKYEPLKEKLRTAVDNYTEDNPVVNELQEDVVNDLKKVGLSSFINAKQVSFKILSVVFLSFIILFATASNLYIVDLNKFLSGIPDAIKQANAKKASSSQLGEINESDDIYGKSKLAVLGDNKIDIKIMPVSFEVSVSEEGDAERKQFDEIFPSEAGIEQSSSYEEDIPEEQQELVKSYFNKLAGS